MGTPARNYSWEQAKPGNFLAEKHGSYSPRRVDPLARELVDLVSAQVDWWRPCDAPSIWRWARLEARVQLLTEYLAEYGDLDNDGSVRPAADLLTRLEARAESMAARLGLDPTSRARLGRDTAATRVDLDTIAERGRRAWAVRDDHADGTLALTAETAPDPGHGQASNATVSAAEIDAQGPENRTA